VTVVAVLAVLANGLAAGIMLSVVMGIAPLMVASDYPQYVRLVRFLWPRYDPVMPAINGGTLVLDLVLVFTGDGRPRVAHLVAAVLLACVMGISVTKNVPVNRFVTTLDPAREPADWPRSDPRRRWRGWNLTRTCFALAAFAANAIGAAGRG
jgi:uncharacterized membrane protein